MEIRTFVAARADNRAQLERKAAGEFEASQQSFDQSTGIEAGPVKTRLTRTALEYAITQHEKAIVEHQAEIQAIRALLATMKAMDDAAPVELVADAPAQAVPPQ